MANVELARGYIPGSIGRVIELHAARHLYETLGFGLVDEHIATQWGKEVNRQRFEQRLE